MTRILRLLAAGLWLFLPGLAAAAELPGDSLYQLSAPWTDQDGRAIQLKSFAGRYVIVAMIYTHCKEMCPMTIESMRKIAADWQSRSQRPLRLLLVSFDSDRDSPAILKQFAAARDLAPDRWTLLQGQKRSVRQLAAALGVTYQKMDNGDWNHANLITLLDTQGRIQLQQAGFVQDPQDIFAKLKESDPAF